MKILDACKGICYSHQSVLIAFVPPRAPQMLNLDSQACWQQAVRKQMTGFKQVAVEIGCKILTNTERATLHILVVSPLTGFLMHEFKAGKTMTGFILI